MKISQMVDNRVESELENAFVEAVNKSLGGTKNGLMHSAFARVFLKLSEEQVKIFLDARERMKQDILNTTLSDLEKYLDERTKQE